MHLHMHLRISVEQLVFHSHKRFGWSRVSDCTRNRSSLCQQGDEQPMYPCTPMLGDMHTGQVNFAAFCNTLLVLLRDLACAGTPE